MVTDRWTKIQRHPERKIQSQAVAFCIQFQRPWSNLSLSWMMTRSIHLSLHLNLTFYLLLSIYIWIKLAANLCLPPSAPMAQTSLFVCLSHKFDLLSFICFSQIVATLFPHHAALLRRHINHSGCLSLHRHTLLLFLQHTCTHTFIHTLMLVSQGELVPSVSVHKSLRVKNEATLRVTKGCFPSGRILPRF